MNPKSILALVGKSSETSKSKEPEQAARPALLRALAFAGIFCCLAVCAYGTPLSAAPVRHGIAAYDLRTEHAVRPLAVETDSPTLSWKLLSAADARGKEQHAYRIVLSESLHALTSQHDRLWDSGKVTSSVISTTYNGPKLVDLHRYYWAMKVWDENGNGSGWSVPASFSVGPRRAVDWNGAQWIAGRAWVDPGDTQAPPAPELRRGFTVRATIVAARLDVCGLGYYDLQLDGAKLDDRVLAPGWTSYNKRVLYDSYDLTKKLSMGFHALGVTLGRGFYANAGGVVGFLGPGPWSSKDPKLLLRLRIVYSDGKSENIITNDSWEAHDGPTTANFEYQGETYDARQETPGWSAKNYKPLGWAHVRVVDGPPGLLAADILDPIRVVASVAPTELAQIDPGVWRFTFPTVKAGWVRLHVNGPRGTKVVLKYAERLHSDGTVNNRGDPGITPGDIQVDTYILKGDAGGETWEPRFSFKSFAYVQVEGFPGTPTLASLTMQVVHTDLANNGTFECSNAILNEIQAMVLRTTLSNFQSLPSDTPMYEKRGWLGDAQVMAATAIQNFDLDRFYVSRVQGIIDDQSANGSVSVLSPQMHAQPDKYQDNGWSSALIIIPWQAYINYGDKNILVDDYPDMARYVNFATTQTVNGILTGSYGDWVPPTGRPNADVKLVETAYLYRDATILENIAAIVGHSQDVQHWNDLASSTLKKFNDVFLNRDKGMYFNIGEADYHQTANAIPLAFGMVPNELRVRVADNLAADVVARGDHLNTGILGTKELLEVLSNTGHPEIAFAVATQTTQPSWGYMLRRTGGRTGVWEVWNYEKIRSLDHMMYGTIGDWFYKNLAGIVPLTAGYGEISIKPDFPAELAWVRAKRTVAAGEVIASWKRVGATYTLDVSVPVNSTAEVSVPVTSDQVVLEGAKSASSAKGVAFVKSEDGRNVYRIGSGTYSFKTVLVDSNARRDAATRN
jgi:alpha-L-rhamnosidase